jgi:N-acetylglucosamine-6-phosphate deacetylase
MEALIVSRQTACIEVVYVSLIVRRARIVSTTRVIEDAYIVVRDGVIVEVGREPYTGLSGAVVNAEGLIVMPGFIDTHTHGIHGLDFTVDREPSSVLQTAKHYVRYGVTGFLATTVTAQLEVLAEACRAVKEARDMWESAYGARILGVHLEGPYISSEAAGAQNRAYIRPPNVEEFKELWGACDNTIKQITLAPELPGASELIAYAKRLGVIVSAGHTQASYEEGFKSVELGVSKATHLFNAMTRLHHREPGIVLALLQSPNVYLEVIADFVHLHPAVVRMIVDYASPKRVILVTDSISATGMPDGVYELGGLKILVKHGVARLVDTGVLAGSTLTMDKAVRNVVRLGYSLGDVALMASHVPAKSLGLSGVGDINVGYHADLVMLSETLNVVRTIVGGEVVYES